MRLGLSLTRYLGLLWVLPVILGCTQQAALDMARVQRAEAALERMDIGLRAFEGGDYARAVRIFSDIQTALPDSSQAATMAVFLHLPDAKAYRRLAASVHNNLGLALFRARRFEQAIAQYRKAIEADPASPLAYRNLATLYLHERRFEAALESIRTAETRGAHGMQLLLDKATASRELGDLATARSTLQRLLGAGTGPLDFKSLDTLSRARHALGLIALESGDTDRAITWFRRTLALNPGSVQARYHLARVLALSGRTTQASEQRQRFEADAARVAAIQGILSKNADRVDALHYVASTYEALGSYALAAAHYRQLLAREPGNLELAASLRRLRERVAALQ